MGEDQFLTKEQALILGKISESKDFFSKFYFTGGTALSAIYLHHRYSEDLDFFSSEKFGTERIFDLFDSWSKKHNFSFRSEFIDPVYFCNLSFPGGNNLKLDFAFYPYPRLREASWYQGLPVDSLFDIAVNKLLSITQRVEAKDFVDLYFLFQEFTVRDLVAGVKTKFEVEIEPLILASHFTLVEDFEFLPRMIKPLALFDLKDFFRQQAKSLGKSLVEP